MADFANLVIGVDTSGLKRGEEALEKTTKAAGATEGKLRNASGQFLKAGESADTASRSLDGFGRTTGQVRGLALEAGKAVAALAVGFFSIQTAFQAFGAANSLNAALAETNTLLSGLPGEIDLVAASARNLADAYGSSDEEQVRAFYQAFSAGSKDAAEATQLLQAANMLAIGGVTDVSTGVDALSTVVNAFGSDVITAAEASDSLFVAMKAGKTTIGELSASLGQIVPIAAASGVSFDETAAAIAALTTQGLSTSSATTGLRAILSSIIAPTDGAAKAASALGLEFSTQAIKAKGFSGFLDDVINKTGGSETVIAELFGSVEALGAVLAFSAGAGDKFADILVDMEDKAGSAALAMDAIDASAADRLGDAFQSISNTFTRLAENSLPMAAAAAEVLASSISFVAGSGEALVAVSKILAVVLAGLAVGQIPALIARLVVFSTTLSGASIATAAFTFATKAARLALIALGGPIGIVFGLLGAAAGAFFLFRDNAGEMTTSAYDAEAGSLALAKALDMVTAAEPDSSASVIALANNNVILANSAYDAAKAELAKRRAMLSEIGVTRGLDPRSNRSATLAGLSQIAKQTEILAEAEASVAKAMSDRVSASEKITAILPEVVDSNSALEVSARTAEEAAALLADTLKKDLPGAAKAAKDAAASAKELTDEIHRLEFNADPIKKYNAELEALNKLSAAGLSDGAYAKAVQDLNDGLADSYPLIGSVSDAFGDFVAGGLQDFKGFVSTILGSFKSMLSQMIATAARNKIMIGMGIGGSAMGTAASAATGGAGGLGGSLAGIGGVGATLGSLGSIFAGSAGITGSAFATGGLAAGFGQVGATLGAVTGSLGSLAAAAGAIALPLLAVVGVFKFFSKSTKLLDEGLQLTVNGMNSIVESFSKTKTSRFFGLSSSTRTNTSQLDAAAASPFTTAIDGIQKSVLSAAAGLGVGADAFSKFSFGFKISLKGLTEEQKMSAVTAELSKMGDAFAAVVPGISSLNELLAVSAERYNLQNRVLELQGRGEELLARQRAAQMNATNGLNKAILQQIFNLEDAASARARADILAQETAKAAADAAQQVAQAAQDAAQAVAALVSSISENDFATGVDFRRGLARASSGIASTPQQSQAEMLAELKALNARIDVLQSTSEITANSSAQTAENTDFSNALALDAAA